jgi:hypothetical protein
VNSLFQVPAMKRTLMDRVRDHLPTLLFGGGAGTCGAIVYMLVEKEPKLALEVIQSWGAPAMLGLVAMVIVDRGVRSLVQSNKETAAAQQRLADAVEQIAKRDDMEAMAQRALMNHVASQTEKILGRFDDLERRAKEGPQAHGASA